MLRRPVAALFLAIAAALLLVASGAAAPTLTLPGTIVAEAQHASGADVTYTASATNPQGKPLDLQCNGPGGGQGKGSLTVTARFPLGDTTVTCSIVDVDGTGASGSFVVRVRDTTGPAVTVPGNIQREANGPAGSVVQYAAATAVDAVDGPVPAACVPVSGSQFSLGTTTVTCTATDAAGNVGSGSFAIAVVDTTPPVLSVPAGAAISTGTAPVPATHPAIQAFLAGASARDIVDPSPNITTDAPAAFPAGTTTVRFTATDASGNVVSATSTVTVSVAGSPPPPPGSPPPPPGTPPPPAPTQPPLSAPDTTPPRDVSGVRAQSGDRLVVVTWALPPDSDLDRIVVTRSLSSSGAPKTVVFTGRATRLADRAVRNSVEYRYALVSYDRAGNRSAGVAVVARPTASALLAPANGARTARPPRLAWVRVANATYYNVQVSRGATKILSAWPAATHLALKRTWRYGGRRQSLVPGAYRWYVWAGFGPRSQRRYGALLGERTFVVTP